MKVVWDSGKARSNLKKHGVRFPDAELVLFDPMALTYEDKDAEGERRFVSTGTDATGRIVVVVYTYRGEVLRMISERKATGIERRSYEA